MSEAPVDPEIQAFAQRVFDAARAGDTAMLEPLLQQGLPPNLANEKGDSLLMLAAYHGNADLVRLLAHHGADPSMSNDRGQSPLAGAAFKGYVDVVTALAEAGAALDAGEPGQTPLAMARMFNRDAVVERLLSLGARM